MELRVLSCSRIIVLFSASICACNWAYKLDEQEDKWQEKCERKKRIMGVALSWCSIKIHENDITVHIHVKTLYLYVCIYID